MVGQPAPGDPSPVKRVGVPAAAAALLPVDVVVLLKGAAKDVEARERRARDARVKDILKESINIACSKRIVKS